VCVHIIYWPSCKIIGKKLALREDICAWSRNDPEEGDKGGQMEGHNKETMKEI